MATSSISPCAACKFLRRKCQPECVFAPYFPPDQPQKFVNVHKVFGASNVTKLLNDLHPHQREDAVTSLAYEAEMRLRDPVYGCVSVISLLQHQLRQLQMDLSCAKSELSKYQNVSIAGHGLISTANGPMSISLSRNQFFTWEQQMMMRNYDNEMARLSVNGAYDASLLAMNVSASIGAPLDQIPHPRAGGDEHQIVQKCQVGIERLQEVYNKFSELETEKKDLQEALEARDQKLREEADVNVGLVAELDAAKAEISRLKAEAAAKEKQAAELEAALEKQKAELEATMEKQKAELEAKFQAENEAAFDEGEEEATKSYEVQVFKVGKKSWELGRMAALKKAEVPEDHPAYQNPSKFPGSDPRLSSVPASSADPEVAGTEPAA